MLENTESNLYKSNHIDSNRHGEIQLTPLKQSLYVKDAKCRNLLHEPLNLNFYFGFKKCL